MCNLLPVSQHGYDDQFPSKVSNISELELPGIAADEEDPYAKYTTILAVHGYNDELDRYIAMDLASRRLHRRGAASSLSPRKRTNRTAWSMRSRFPYSLVTVSEPQTKGEGMKA